VRRALIPISREVVVSEPKTVKGRRVIALDPVTVEVLKAQAQRQLDDHGKWQDAWVDSGLVFTLENGEALDPEDVSRYWRQAVKKAMLPQIRLHDLRHTHATLALQASVHPKVVSGRLGHATVSITLDTYSHAIGATGGGGSADRRAGVRGRLASACREATVAAATIASGRGPSMSPRALARSCIDNRHSVCSRVAGRLERALVHAYVLGATHLVTLLANGLDMHTG
jgi:hypothetical protein